MDKAKIQVT